MVYANFSSNLPTGLQHFEFVDLTNTGKHKLWRKSETVHSSTQWRLLGCLHCLKSILCWGLSIPPWCLYMLWVHGAACHYEIGSGWTKWYILVHFGRLFRKVLRLIWEAITFKNSCFFTLHKYTAYEYTSVIKLIIKKPPVSNGLIFSFYSEFGSLIHSQRYTLFILVNTKQCTFKETHYFQARSWNSFYYFRHDFAPLYNISYDHVTRFDKENIFSGQMCVYV